MVVSLGAVLLSTSQRARESKRERGGGSQKDFCTKCTEAATGQTYFRKSTGTRSFYGNPGHRDYGLPATHARNPDGTVNHPGKEKKEKKRSRDHKAHLSGRSRTVIICVKGCRSSTNR